MYQAKNVKLLLIVCTVVFGLLIVPGWFMAMMSVMMFDSPGSETSIQIRLLWLSIASFPVLSFLSIPFSRIFYTKKKYLPAIIAALCPLVSIVVFLVLRFVLNILCNGQFTC